ncbi:YCF48-related protein [Chloroflexota bacterium]
MKKWTDRILTMVAVVTLGIMCLPLQATPARADMDGAWIQLSSFTATDLNRIFFTDEDTGWVVGLNGEIWHTEDGGQTWERQGSGITSVELEGVYFLDENNGWVVGAAGKMLHTTNGGAAWQELPDASNSVRNVHMISATEGWATGWGVIVKTSDGTTWTDTKPAGFTNLMLDGATTGADTFWCVGKTGDIQYTSDGGSNWTKQVSGTESFLYGIIAHDANNLITYGQSGTVLKTDNGGTTWTTVDTGIDSAITIRGASFIDADNGVLVGNEGQIWNTDDGGDTWTVVAVSPTTAQLQDVFMVDADTGYAVGLAGTVLKYTTEAIGNLLATNIHYSGSGVITLDPSQPPTGYAPGTVVTITAVAGDGLTFVEWSGDASGTDATTTVTMNAAKSVTANFLPDVYYRLIVSRTPADSGTVTIAPVQPEDGYEMGTEVTLTAVAETGYHFKEWSGDVSGRNATITIEMDRAMSVIANFAEGSGCCAGAAATAADIGSGIGVIGILGLAVTCLHFRKKKD